MIHVTDLRLVCEVSFIKLLVAHTIVAKSIAANKGQSDKTNKAN